MKQLLLTFGWGFALGAVVAGGPVPIEQVYEAPGSADQDDMCVWIHPAEPDESTVVTSDKAAGRVYVYDLAGQLLQSISSPMPGNIDVRYGIQLGGECVDLVAFNERTEQRIRVYRVDPATRLLVRVDNGAITTGPNYGFALSRREDGKLTGVTGPSASNGAFREYELVDDGTGHVRGAVTGWQVQASTIEGMVADDDAGWIFLAEEDVGVWRVKLDDALDKTLIATVGDASGLAADVEGLTIYHVDAEQGYLIASSQPTNRFEVYDREPPHQALGDFSVTGVGQSDGIDVVNTALGESFPEGLFAFHNGQDCCPVQSALWDAIASAVGLAVDTTSWHPRRTCGPHLSVSKSALSWSASSPATSYDVVRGDLGVLGGSGGDFSRAATGCLANNFGSTAITYTGAPAAGQAEWYLVRGVASFGPLSYDSYGPAQSVPRHITACD